MTSGGEGVEGSVDALNLLSDNKIPYVLLTNNLSKSESYKASEINSIFQLKVPLEEKHIILNYTPLKSMVKWQDKIVLLVGIQKRICGALPLPEMPKYITIEEYCTIFPQVVPLSERLINESVKDLKMQICERLGIKHLERDQIEIGAVLILTPPNRWEESYQVIIDLLSTSKGQVTLEKQYKHVSDHIPIITTHNDMFYSNKDHHLPRILTKSFNEGLKNIFREVYNADLKITTLGKPEPATYQYAKIHLQQHHGAIEKLVMIGDNVQTDIFGAYQAGWDSILVKTGVSQQNSQWATINSPNIYLGLREYLKIKEAILN